MDQFEIQQLIQEDIRADIHGDLYGHDRVAEIIAQAFDAKNREIAALKDEIAKLKSSNSSWAGQVDRQGGSFTFEEIAADRSWGPY